MNQYILQILGGIIGMAFHIFAVKLPSYKAKCLAGNVKFRMKGYFECDWMAIVASFLAVLTAVYIMSEIIKLYAPIQDYIKFFMVFVGFTGSSLLIAAFGRANKSALNAIDQQTNELAKIKGEPNPNADIIDAGAAK